MKATKANKSPTFALTGAAANFDVQRPLDGKKATKGKQGVSAIFIELPEAEQQQQQNSSN